MHVRELFDLTGKTALVTGGGRGIGLHITIGLAEAGADVIIASRKSEHCEAAAAAVEAIGVRGRVESLDLTDPESIDALADRVLADGSRLDILVNNAGFIWGEPILDYQLKGWDKVFAVNVRGLWQLSQRAARHMRDAGGGSIVHIASISGLRGSKDEKDPSIAYSAAKGAVITLTKDMAVKLASYGIRVNCLSPGAFDTDMFDHVRGDEEQMEAFFSPIPMRRVGLEDDVKGAVVFLASEASRYVTGHNLIVDGGWFISAG